MGGGEVVRYLRTYGADRVRSAVLAGAVPPYLYQSEDNPEGGLDDATIAQFEAGVRSDRPAFLRGFLRLFFAAGDKDELVSQPIQDHLWNIAAAASPKGTLDCIAAFGRTDFRADVASVTVPTLVLHGDSDGIVPIEISGQRSADSIPGARLHVIAGGPHGLNTSHAEEFNGALLDFLQSADGS
jgi:pimeloyl-ACP methyl ester carboxylesterase